MCGDDPTATPRRLHRCEGCADFRRGVAWHKGADAALCPNCYTSWVPEPPLRARMLGLGRRNLWPHMPADDGLDP